MKEFVEKLIGKLEECIDANNGWEDEDYWRGQNEAYENVKKIIKELAKKCNNGWIPASHPPKLAVIEGGITEVVLIQHEDGRINIGTYKDNSFYSLNIENGAAYMAEDNSVVYWRLSPEPYQQEGEADDHSTNG